MAQSIDIRQLSAQLASIYDNAVALESHHAEDLAAVHPGFRDGALNLVHYLALRQADIRDLQESLAALGLSSLGRVERDVIASIRAVLTALQTMSPAAGDESHREFSTVEPVSPLDNTNMPPLWSPFRPKQVATCRLCPR